MRVLVKFSDLRKLQDENKFLKDNIKILEIRKNELNSETIRLDNALDKAIERERELEAKLENAKDTAEEVKLLTAENNVLIEENNKLKTYSERKQPKFWFGDKVRIKEDPDEVFIIRRMLFEDDFILFSDALEDYYYEENYLELVDENISK